MSIRITYQDTLAEMFVMYNVALILCVMLLHTLPYPLLVSHEMLTIQGTSLHQYTYIQFIYTWG